MGVVYKAIDRCLERPVALKLLRGGEPEKARRFLAEARLLARLDHPNLCRVYDAGRLGGRPFVALELVEGPTLGEAAPALALEEKLRVALGLAEGLAAVHQAGLVHRDVKPANVVVGRRPDGSLRPCLVDFGIAREAGAGDGAETGVVLGTPAYLAPEQAAAGAVDPRTDLYAVGAVLYELLAGEPPFGLGDSAKLIRRVLAEEPRPLAEVRPELPADLAALVMRCLAKDPDRRHPSAEALAADLRRLLAAPALAKAPVAEALDAALSAETALVPEVRDGAPARPPHPSAVRRPWPPNRRRNRRRLAAAAALAALSFAALWRARAVEARPDLDPNSTMVDIFYLSRPESAVEAPMALNLKNADVERLVEGIAALTGESKTEAVRKALEERMQRLSLQVVRPDRKEQVLRFLEREVWPRVPPDLAGRGVPQEEQDEILGYGPDGV
jgi:hypothetical protein